MDKVGCNEGVGGLGRSPNIVKKAKHRQCVVFGTSWDGGKKEKKYIRRFHSANCLKYVHLEDRYIYKKIILKKI